MDGGLCTAAGKPGTTAKNAGGNYGVAIGGGGVTIVISKSNNFDIRVDSTSVAATPFVVNGWNLGSASCTPTQGGTGFYGKIFLGTGDAIKVE